ncbi:hypothetical protein [Aeromicrobium sp. Sec7.5]|uniref:hypothetical protein n=1 Tax=Aeromicrobium sp. Sec7.5 TaxID=3121276 RepID=UPI002FE433B9
MKTPRQSTIEWSVATMFICGLMLLVLAQNDTLQALPWTNFGLALAGLSAVMGMALAIAEADIWPELDITDYAERTEQTITAWSGMNGQQGGDPAKLAVALVTLSDSGDLPLRFLAGSDVMAGVEQNLATIQEQINAHRELSASLAYDA